MEKIDKKLLHELFNKIKQGDNEAYNMFYNNYYKMIYGICFSILKNKEDSEDVTQTVFTKLLKMPSEKMANDNETTWLYTVTKNEVLQFLRKKTDEVDLASVYNIYISDKELEEIVNMDEYNKLTKNLNEKQKQIVSLKILCDFTFKEIGLMLNMPTATVQWYYYKSINILKYALSSIATFILGITTSIKMLSKNNVKDMQSNNLEEDSISKEEFIENEVENSQTDNAILSPENMTGNVNSEKNETSGIQDTDNTENIIGTEPNDNVFTKGNVDFIWIPAIFFIISIIFLIFFKKSQQKLRKKSSK